jgi:hypothetical protein
MKRSRVRVERVDHPQGPEHLVAAIGAVGGRVVSVDMQEVDGPSTVEELVTELPDDTGREELAVAVARHAGATLLSSRDADRTADPVAQALRVARTVVEGGDDGLTSAISATCVYTKSWVSRGAAARSVPTGRMAIERGRSVVQGAGEPRGWLLAVPHHDDDRVAFVARPLSLRFTADEVARVEALVRLRDCALS